MFDPVRRVGVYSDFSSVHLICTFQVTTLVSLRSWNLAHGNVVTSRSGPTRLGWKISGSMMAATSWSQRVTKLSGGTWMFWTTPEGRAAEGDEALLHSTCSSESVWIWWQNKVYFSLSLFSGDGLVLKPVETDHQKRPSTPLQTPVQQANELQVGSL